MGRAFDISDNKAFVESPNRARGQTTLAVGCAAWWTLQMTRGWNYYQQAGRFYAHWELEYTDTYESPSVTVRMVGDVNINTGISTTTRFVNGAQVQQWAGTQRGSTFFGNWPAGMLAGAIIKQSPFVPTDQWILVSSVFTNEQFFADDIARVWPFINDTDPVEHLTAVGFNLASPNVPWNAERRGGHFGGAILALNAVGDLTQALTLQPMRVGFNTGCAMAFAVITRSQVFDAGAWVLGSSGVANVPTAYAIQAQRAIIPIDNSYCIATGEYFFPGSPGNQTLTCTPVNNAGFVRVNLPAPTGAIPADAILYTEFDENCTCQNP